MAATARRNSSPVISSSGAKSCVLAAVLLLLTSCSGILDSYKTDGDANGSNINGFNINIRSIGGAGSGAGGWAAAPKTLETATRWDSEESFGQAVSRFRVQIGDEPERVIKLGNTITSQRLYSPGEKVTVSYMAEADVTYTVQGEGDTQTRTMLIARETREIKIGAGTTQVAFRIRDTMEAGPKQSYTGYKVKLLNLATPTTGSTRGINDNGSFVYVEEGDPLSEYFVGNFNNNYNNMYGFTGKLETFAEWVGKEYNVTQTDINNGFIDCNTLLENGFLVAGVPLDIDNNYYLQELTDWELFKFYGTGFERERLGNLGGGTVGGYYRVVPFAPQDKPAYQYITLKSTGPSQKIDVKNEFGIKDVVAGGRLKLEGMALKLADDANPYDKNAVNAENKKLFDAANSVVGPYYSPREYSSVMTLDQNTDGILYLMQDGGKRQMLVYRPKTVEVTFNYNNVASQTYWKDSTKTEKKIIVPIGTTVTKDDIAKLLKAESKDGYDISYTGADVFVDASTNNIAIQSADITATRLCRVTLKYDYGAGYQKQEDIYVTENKVINDEILEFLNTNTECTKFSYTFGMDQVPYTTNVYYKWDETKK